MARPKSPLVACATPNCWQTAKATSGFCTACKSWWYRMRNRSASEFADYLKRQDRMHGRLTVYDRRSRG